MDPVLDMIVVILNMFESIVGFSRTRIISPPLLIGIQPSSSKRGFKLPTFSQHHDYCYNPGSQVASDMSCAHLNAFLTAHGCVQSSEYVCIIPRPIQTRRFVQHYRAGYRFRATAWRVVLTVCTSLRLGSRRPVPPYTRFRFVGAV